MAQSGEGSILVLGGTAWLGSELARQAAASGWAVTCLARGESGPVPEGVRLIRADRSSPHAYDEVAQQDWDAVVDVTWQPGMARSAVGALGERAARWVYVSSISAYAGETPDAQVEDAAVHDPWPHDEATMAEYGPAKSACEAIVRNVLGERSVVARLGLIAGPGDPSDRFGYWVARFALAGERSVLVPDAAQHRTQVVDVRDAAAWLLVAAGSHVSGAVNVVGATVPFGEVLAACADAAGFTGAQAVASEEFLVAERVEPWAGPRSLPLWLPEADAEFFGGTSDERAVAAGLVRRPLHETIADVLADERSRGLDRPRQAGLTWQEERELISRLS